MLVVIKGCYYMTTVRSLRSQERIVAVLNLVVLCGVCGLMYERIW